MASCSLLVHQPRAALSYDYYCYERSKSTNFNGMSYPFSPRIGSKTRRGSLECKCQVQLTELAPATSAAYGALLLGGGLFAFSKSGSKGSLYGGLTGAALMTTETKAFGEALGFGSAFLFSSVFGIRLAASRKLTPAGPLLGISICALSVFLFAYLHDRI
ncbi:protein FATTY ACID EXPORT 4, chloroplastic isoform X2 [Tripterygium wilfordii]|uniref:protein FATTY ACID EXPORT 4, chloroplastic isoform X2 n=1 Tax=Tripterygium wilfordii TaxID=458696 RepID=UPI0018F7F7A4|nr:protein FATTY ACID EXPORT 4, chloroplastic isoform X2 [Tripterygium wilfordii]